MTGVTKPALGPYPKLTIFYRLLANWYKRKAIIVNKQGQLLLTTQFL